MNEKENLTTKETFALAVQHHQKNNLQVAEKLYREILKTNPNHANTRNNLGSVLKELGESQKAISCFQKAIEIQSNHVNAHYNLGRIYVALGDIQKAINSYQEALKYEPKNLFYYYHLSDLMNEILNSNLKNKINKIMKESNLTKKNLAYGNFLLSSYELKLKNYEKEFNYLLKGHLYYFETPRPVARPEQTQKPGGGRTGRIGQ